jgi:hypothetical protein
VGGLARSIAYIVAAPAWWYAQLILRIFPRYVQPWPLVLPWATVFLVCLWLGWDAWKKDQYSRSVLFFGIALWQVVTPVIIASLMGGVEK